MLNEIYQHTCWPLLIFLASVHFLCKLILGPLVTCLAPKTNLGFLFANLDSHSYNPKDTEINHKNKRGSLKIIWLVNHVLFEILYTNNTLIKSTRVDESSSLNLDLSIFFAVAGVEIKSIEETFLRVSRDLWLAGRLLLPAI